MPLVSIIAIDSGSKVKTWRDKKKVQVKIKIESV